MRVNYAQAVYGEEEIAAVVEVLRNSPEALMVGPRVAQFEAAVARQFGKDHGVMVNSGSSANMIAVAGLGIAAGSEVITPALTFSTTVAPLVQNKLIPVFVDVEPDTFNIDAGAIESKVSDRTRALFIPNLIGNLPDWRLIRAVADRHDLLVIEDSCDTIGSRVEGSPTANLTDVSTTSFYASHIMTAAGFGGMMLTSDGDLVDRARLLRGWGRTSSIRSESERIEDRFDVEVAGIEYDAKFLFAEIGYNFLPSEISAAFGLVQLDRLEEYSRLRRQNFMSLDSAFEPYDEWFARPRQRSDVDTAWLAYPIIVRDSAPFSRREFQTALELDNIQTRVVFTGNILRQPGFAHLAREGVADNFPNADWVMRGGVLLGCHQGMSKTEVDYIMDSVDRFMAVYR